MKDEEKQRCAELCEGCRLGWDLGRHGCHFEPIPPDLKPDEDWDSVIIRCQAWPIRRLEFLPDAGHQSPVTSHQSHEVSQ